MSEVTPERMRALAKAIDGHGAGITIQPVYPKTLRLWAKEIEALSARLQAVEAERDALREALERITWVLDEDHGAMEATAVRYARAALASRQEPLT